MVCDMYQVSALSGRCSRQVGLLCAACCVGGERKREGSTSTSTSTLDDLRCPTTGQPASTPQPEKRETTARNSSRGDPTGRGPVEVGQQREAGGANDAVEVPGRRAGLGWMVDAGPDGTDQGCLLAACAVLCCWCFCFAFLPGATP